MGETKNLDTFCRPAKVWFLVDNEETARRAFAYNTVTWGGRFNFVIDVTSSPDWISLSESNPDLVINLTPSLPDNFPQAFRYKVRSESEYFTNGMNGKAPLLCSIEAIARFVEKTRERVNVIIPNDFETTRNYHQVFLFGLFPTSWPDKSRMWLDKISAPQLPYPEAKKAWIENTDSFTPLRLTIWDLEGSTRRRWPDHRSVCVVIGDTNSYQDAIWAWNIRASGHIVFFLDQTEQTSTVDDLVKWRESLTNLPGERSFGHLGTIFASKVGDISAFKARLQPVFGEHLHSVSYPQLWLFSDFFAGMDIKTQPEHRIGYVNDSRFEFEPALPDFANFLGPDQRIGIGYELPSFFSRNLNSVPCTRRGQTRKMLL